MKYLGKFQVKKYENFTLLPVAKSVGISWLDRRSASRRRRRIGSLRGVIYCSELSIAVRLFADYRALELLPGRGHCVQNSAAHRLYTPVCLPCLHHATMDQVPTTPHTLTPFQTHYYYLRTLFNLFQEKKNLQVSQSKQMNL